MRTILGAREKLEEMGMRRPSIRAVLYYLMQLPGWNKKHYNTLCSRLGRWRDEGLIPWGLFGDDGAGMALRPMTDSEIRERIKSLEGATRAQLLPDGYIHTVFVEHAGMVETIANWLDWRIPVVSSQGQIRREHLYTHVSGWYKVADELNAEGVKCVALVDWDRAGRKIYEAHERWLRKIFKLRPSLWALTSEQIRRAGLPVYEDHQLDGVIAVYGPQQFRRELRAEVGL